MTQSVNGKIFIISGPSGVGKTTICKQLCNSIPHLKWSISATTRPQRSGEIDGSDYYFLNSDEFLEKLDNNEFLEYAQVHGNYYGTPITPIEQGLAIGDSYLLEIDVQGAKKIQQQKKFSPIFIFIAPPDWKTLEQRLINRNTDSAETIKMRLQNAKTELEQQDFYHHIIINENLEQAIKKIQDIIVKMQGVERETIGN